MSLGQEEKGYLAQVWDWVTRTNGPNADATESIDSAGSFTILQVERMIEGGEIFDALSLAAMCHLQILLRRDKDLRQKLKYELK